MLKSEKSNTAGLANPSSKRIMCVGMCVLDIVHVCEQYPVEDSDRRCRQGYLQRGGNASNNCTVLRLLGSNVEFLGMLSKAAGFAFLEDDCNKRGIIIVNCPTTEQDPPFSSVILVNSTGTRTIIHSNSGFPILTHEYFKRCNLNEYTWIHFEGRNHTETIHMLRDIHAHNEHSAIPITISVELEKITTDNMLLAEMADYVFLGKDLALFLDWQNPKMAVYGLRDMLKPSCEFNNRKPNIICAWGADGADYLDSENNWAHLPAAETNHIEDSLGAGDTFVAATIHALQDQEMCLPNAVEFGNRVAAHKLGSRGYECVSQFRT